jgi:hypothetical protein
MVAVSFYAFVSNYISASIAPALPLWNRQFPQDRKPTRDLMTLVAVCALSVDLHPGVAAVC